MKRKPPETKKPSTMPEERRTGMEPDEQWNDMVYNPAIEAAFDAEIAAKAKALGRPLTGDETGMIAHKYMS